MSALDRILEAAAEERGQAVRAATDRPSQRRWAEEPGGVPGVRAKVGHLDLREAADGSGGLHFSGFASVYNRGYEMWDMFGPYSEQVSSGAGAQSLARADLDVPFVLAHDPLRRMARTINGDLTLSESVVGEDEGLLVDAPSLDAGDPDVAYITPKLRSGLIDEMSFRFRIEAGSWSPDWTEYHIERYDIHRGDVAIVGYGANPHTQGAGLRSQQALPALREMTDADLRARENEIVAEIQRRGLAVVEATRSGMSFTQLDVIAASIL